MKKNNILGFASGNLMLGGFALVLTAIFIATNSPTNRIVFITPYSGNQAVFSRILAMIGCLASMPSLDAWIRDEKISLHRRDNLFSCFY